MSREKFNFKRYAKNNCEFNLATMFERTIKRAFRTLPDTPVEVIAGQLGISDRTLWRIVKDWGLR